MKLPTCSILFIHSLTIYVFSIHALCCLTTAAITPPFSTMAMLGLRMTRQFWMETCGESPSVVLKFWLKITLDTNLKHCDDKFDSISSDVLSPVVYLTWVESITATPQTSPAPSQPTASSVQTRGPSMRPSLNPPAMSWLPSNQVIIL